VRDLLRLACRAVVALAVVLFASCGGGGGGGGGDAQAPATIAGRVWALGAGAGLQPLSNADLELATVNNGGAVVTTVMRTKSGADGSFSFQLPAGRQPGLDLMLLAGQSNSRSRAFVLDADVDVGPASEAFVLDALSALAAFGVTPSVEVGRLARFQRAASTFLTLIESAAANEGDLIREYRGWLRDDPASRDAFAALRTSGMLPATLGDIGGMFGQGKGAWVAQDTDLGQRIYTVRPSTADPTIFETFDASADQYGDLHLGANARTRIKLEDDGYTVLKEYLPDGSGPLAEQLANIIGSTRLSRFGQAPGKPRHIRYLPQKTFGLTFDADQLEDDLSREVEVDHRGIETIGAFGKQLKALRVDTTIRTDIQLSMGGTLTFLESRKEWSVPFAGMVKAETVFTSIDAAGRQSTDTSQASLVRGVLNEVSWPGGVYANLRNVQGLGSVAKTFYPVGATSNRGLAYIDYDSSTTTSTILIVDTDTGLIRASVDLPRFAAQRFVKVRRSPDGSKLFAVHSSSATDLKNTVSIDPLPLDQANALGAIVTQYDALTLAEEHRVTIPALASDLLPGYGYPRREAGSTLALGGPNHRLLVDTTAGAVVIQGGQVLPSMLPPPKEEIPYLGSAYLNAYQYNLAVWDPVADEVYAYASYLPPPFVFGNTPYWTSAVLPLQSSGWSGSAWRSSPAAQQLATLFAGQGRDQYAAGRIYVDDFRQVVDASSGQVTGVAADQYRAYPGGPGHARSCGLTASRVVCSLSSGVVFLNPSNLAAEQTVVGQNDLRRLSGSSILSSGMLDQHAGTEFTLSHLLTPLYQPPVYWMVRLPP
jgi:hypothetical protein